MAKKKSNAKQRPQILLIACCDHVSRDPNSKKVTLYGLYDRILPTNLAEFSFNAFVKLFGGTGKHKINFGLKSSVTGKMAWNDTSAFDLPFKVTAPVDLVIRFEKVKVPRVGKYELVVFCDGELYSQTYPLTIAKQNAV